MITFDAFHRAMVDAGCYCWDNAAERIARCPAHQDDTPSVSYRQGTNGAEVVAHCFAGCDYRAMLSALALPAGPTPVIYKEPPPKRSRAGRRHGSGELGDLLAIYEYQDTSGTPLHRTVKYAATKGKTFRQEHWNGTSWRPGLNGIKPVLYHLPQLAAAPDAPVLFVEGEKDADNATAAGFLTTTTAMGAANWSKTDLAPLDGREVTLVADNDEAGRSYVRGLADALLPRTRSLRAIEQLPGVGPGGDVTDFLASSGPDALRQLISDTPTAAVPHSTWWRVDLDPILAGDIIDEPPVMLARLDGHCLLYAGKIHAFIGEPESAKGWAALHACAERLRAGEPVLYVDFEDSAATAVARLLALGLEPDQIRAGFHYLRPEESVLSDQAQRDLVEQLDLYRPTLAIVDGVTEALALHGWDLNDNTDQARYLATVPRRLAISGAAVLQLDHVVKARDARGGYAIGAQHKKAGIDVQYTFDVVKPFGRGLEGQVKLSVTKDRPGHVRGAAGFGKHAADLILSSSPAGDVVEVELRPPPNPNAPFRPTRLMEQVSHFIEAAPEPLSVNTILAGVTGKKTNLRQALACLVAEGFVSEETGPNRARLHRSLKPFREAVGPVGPGGSPVGPGPSHTGGSVGPTPFRGGPTQDPLVSGEDPVGWVPDEDQSPWD